MHRCTPVLRPEMAPYPIFGPLVGLVPTYCTVLPSIHVSLLFFSASHCALVSPYLSTILCYRFDSRTFPPNGHVTPQVHKLGP